MIVFFRALLLYIVIIFSVRMMGKRQLGDLQPSEVVTTILIGNIAAIPIEDHSVPMAAAVIPILTLSALEVLLSQLSLRSRRLRLLITGRPRTVIRAGEIDQKALREIRFTLDDLMENLRGQGVFDLREVWCCVVETNGKVNVQKRFPSRPLTPKDMQLKGSDTLPPVAVIADGELLPNAMALYGITPAWVEKMLKLRKKKPSEIFLMTVDGDRNCLIVEKDERKGRAG